MQKEQLHIHMHNYCMLCGIDNIPCNISEYVQYNKIIIIFDNITWNIVSPTEHCYGFE